MIPLHCLWAKLNNRTHGQFECDMTWFCFCFDFVQIKQVDCKMSTETVAYPGLSLGMLFFVKQNLKGSWKSESLGHEVRHPGKSFMFTFRESFKHAQMFLGLIASSLK